MNRVPLLLGEAIQPAVNWAVAEAAAAQDVRLLRRGPRRSRCWSTATPTRVEQIAWNLLSNAIKFSRSGGTHRRARSRAKRERGVLEVSDTGRGIAPAFLPHVFEHVQAGRFGDHAATKAGWASAWRW